MNYYFVDEGMGPEMPEVVSDNFNASKGDKPLYFFKITCTDWVISTTPITKEKCREVFSAHYPHEAPEDLEFE